MSTKTKPSIARTKSVCGQNISDTTLQQIGMNISPFLDLMNDPDFKEEKFRQIFSQTKNRTHLAASNDEMFIYFEIQWKKKGGKA